MPHLDVQLLGNFQLSYNDRSLINLLTTRLQTLLVYLLMHYSAPQPRHHIAFLFWPDTSEKQALTNLRTLYARLRQKLPDVDLFIQSDTQTIQWLPESPFTLDVAEFETAVATADTAAGWQHAIDLYHGTLLPGWYEEWLEPARARLQQLFVRANETLIQLMEEQREYEKAGQAARLLLRHDPLHEATYRRLMRLQALTGNKADALRTYHTCTTLLENELGVTPDEATRTLYEQLIQSKIDPELLSGIEPETTVIPLIGRDEEWTQLKSSWKRAVRGRATMVFIIGEAGIGKSRLAAELLQWANRQGIDTVSTRSYEAEGELAYEPVLTWLRSPVLQSAWKKLADTIQVELARLMPELLIERLDLPAPTPLTHSWQRQRLFEALAQAALARDRPLLLHIDDLQWCDEESLHWLHFLLRFDPKAPLLIVGAFRPEEVDTEHPLTALQLALRKSRQLKELELRPMPKEDAIDLAAQFTEQPLSSAEISRLYRETEGNPLFVIELMRVGLLDSHSLPPTIQAMLQSRFALLSPQARELMAQAAVIGRAFDYDLLFQTMDMPEDVLVTRLDELWQRRIIREHGNVEYDFSHDKLREAAYSELSLTRRHLLHRRVAQTLEALHASHIEVYSGQIATHYEMANMPGEAIPFYQKAANAARRLFANAEAISHIHQAIKLLTFLATDTASAWRLEKTVELNETLGDLLYFTAQYEAGQEAYGAALTAVDTLSDPHPILHGRLHRKKGSACLPLHQYEDALDQFDQAMTALGQEPGDQNIRWWREWIDLQQERKYTYYWLNLWPEIAEILAESRPAVTQYGTPQQRALFFDHTMYFLRDRFTVTEEVLEIAREWLAAHLELEDPIRLASAQFGMGFALLWYGDLAEAEIHINQALEMTHQTGDVNLRARCLTYLTILYRKRNQVEQVRELAAKSEAAAEKATMLEYVAMAKANMAWVAWRSKAYQQAQSDGRAALKLWQTMPAGHPSTAFQWTALFPLLDIEVEKQNLDEATIYVQKLLQPSQQKLPEALTAVLQKALITDQQSQLARTTNLLNEALALAQQMHFL